MTEPSRGYLYADTSALVKLVILEPETDAVDAEIDRWDRVATSDFTTIELPRAVARAKADGRDGVGDGRLVLEVLAGLAITPMTDEVRALAASMEPAHLRALDAIHLASALSLHDDLAAVMTYDRRMAEAAEARGLVVIAPS